MSGIYVHFPFCRKKCVYCNFYSVARTELKTDYIKALLCEIEARKEELCGAVETLYFGGGTPSLCSISELDSVVGKLRATFPFNSEIEFTVEANPEQLTKEYLNGLRTIGVNRLSIGVQSFDDRILKSLGRTHDSAAVTKALDNALAAGFDNISIDLIYGIMEREKGGWRSDIEKALSYPISHLSAYSLTVEENTLLHRSIRNSSKEPPSESCSVDDYGTLLELTAKSGFVQYEVSNFARNGKISRHNFSYWTHTPYLGLGAAAHSFDGKSRRWNVADIRQYISSSDTGQPLHETEHLTQRDLFNEYVLLRLRTNKGINLDEIADKFGERHLRSIENRFTTLPQNFYIAGGNNLTLTSEGLLHADNIAMELFEV